jgi:hypothetical protein
MIEDVISYTVFAPNVERRYENTVHASNGNAWHTIEVMETRGTL